MQQKELSCQITEIRHSINNNPIAPLLLVQNWTAKMVFILLKDLLRT